MEYIKNAIMPESQSNGHTDGHTNGANGHANGAAANGHAKGHLSGAHHTKSFKDYQTDRNAKAQNVVYTTSNGAPYPHPYEAQRAGENGPLLLQDFHLIDLLSHFDRERIPERVVHAKGGGAHGKFVCTNPIPELTMMDIFSKAGKECSVSMRFSTVGGESGSHDQARDPRGFSVKFRTEEGNWDIVANNTPVFFLRDPAKFPHFIHTQKRNPSTHLTHMDDSTVFWDYLSQNPESVHQVMILMGDRGIPENWRNMHGYYGHTMKFINKNNEWIYVQIHIKSQQGEVKFVKQEDSASYSADHSTKDLYDAIEQGNYPKWNLEIQTMTPQEAERAWAEEGINIFDLTHVWPQSKYPLKKVGEFVLDENPANYFAEIEQIAFSPSHLVPGIEPSADPVLQSRLFSYTDTHRHRLGVNYQQLPVNAPNTKYHNASFQRDGQGAFFNQGARPNYISSIEPIHMKPRVQNLDKIHGHFIGQAVSFLSAIRPEDFNAPRALWEKVFDEGAKERFIKNVSGHMENIAEAHKKDIISRQIAIFREVSPDIATRLEKATGVKGGPDIRETSYNGTINGFQQQAKSNGFGQGAPIAGSHAALAAH